MRNATQPLSLQTEGSGGGTYQNNPAYRYLGYTVQGLYQLLPTCRDADFGYGVLFAVSGFHRIPEEALINACFGIRRKKKND
jgi:hypothetical protein